MHEKQTKIGVTDIGGLFVGKGIHSDFLEHYAISILFTLNDYTFKIETLSGEVKEYRAVIIQKNTAFRLDCHEKQYVAFMHLLPYSSLGLSLSDNQQFKTIKYSELYNIRDSIKNWFYLDHNDDIMVNQILESLEKLVPPGKVLHRIDKRVLKALHLIMNSEGEKLLVRDVALQVCLSISHFNRLFKKETGLSFRKFVLHSKLIRSIIAIGKQNSLTQASFIGGFSDQPHLTRTFKKSFGIKPSTVKK